VGAQSKNLSRQTNYRLPPQPPRMKMVSKFTIVERDGNAARAVMKCKQEGRGLNGVEKKKDRD